MWCCPWLWPCCAGWAELDGTCLAPVSHQSTDGCPDEVQFGAARACLQNVLARKEVLIIMGGALTPSEKNAKAVACRAAYACLGSVPLKSAPASADLLLGGAACVANWGAACPGGWELDELGYCRAPTTYAGPCAVRMKMAQFTKTQKSAVSTASRP